MLLVEQSMWGHQTPAGHTVRSWSSDTKAPVNKRPIRRREREEISLLRISEDYCHKATLVSCYSGDIKRRNHQVLLVALQLLVVMVLLELELELELGSSLLLQAFPSSCCRVLPHFP